MLVSSVFRNSSLATKLLQPAASVVGRSMTASFSSTPDEKPEVKETTTAGTSSEFAEESVPRTSLLVVGGNGYVGSHVCKAALEMGLHVVSVSRSGRPTNIPGEWVDEVEWAVGDAMGPEPWRKHLEGALGVVSCVGAFGSNDFMYKVCGEANISVIAAAKAAGVPRFAFISAHDFKFPEFVLKGYVQGKKAAEAALQEQYPEGGVSLRPGFVHGTRHVGSMTIPLGMIGGPLETIVGMIPGNRSLAAIPTAGAAFVPPVSAEVLGKAAVRAATDPGVPSGVMDAWTIQEYK